MAPSTTSATSTRPTSRLRSELLDSEAGGFSTDFPAAAFEDAELAYRLSMRGMRIVYRASALAWHHHHYDARSFFDRQLKCGEMADVFVRAHPQLAKWIDLRVLMWHRLEVLTADRPTARRSPECVRISIDWERRAIDLAVFLDDPATDLADPLLYSLFRYGFVRGLATARFGPTAGARSRPTSGCDCCPTRSMCSARMLGRGECLFPFGMSRR